MPGHLMTKFNVPGANLRGGGLLVVVVPVVRGRRDVDVGLPPPPRELVLRDQRELQPEIHRVDPEFGSTLRLL